MWRARRRPTGPPRRSAVAHPTARVARVGREQANGGTGGFDGRARPRGEQTARNSEEDGSQLGLRPAPSPPHAKHARTCHAGPFKRAHRSMGTPKAARTISEASQAGHQHASTPTTASRPHRVHEHEVDRHPIEKPHLRLRCRTRTLAAGAALSRAGGDGAPAQTVAGARGRPVDGYGCRR